MITKNIVFKTLIYCFSALLIVLSSLKTYGSLLYYLRPSVLAKGDPTQSLNLFFGGIFLMISVVFLTFIAVKGREDKINYKKWAIIFTLLFGAYYFFFDLVFNCGLFCISRQEAPPRFHFLY